MVNEGCWLVSVLLICETFFYTQVSEAGLTKNVTVGQNKLWTSMRRNPRGVYLCSVRSLSDFDWSKFMRSIEFKMAEVHGEQKGAFDGRKNLS